MLTESPCLHIPAESGFLPELRDRVEDYGDFTDPRARWFFVRDLQHVNATSKTKAFDIFRLTAEEAENAIAEAAPTDYPGAAAALFQSAARRKGKRRWGDKTPRYVLHVDWLASAFPGSRFLHIIRDPRDVTTSIRRAGWGTSYRNAAEFWVERVKAGRNAGRTLGGARYREVRYEDLVRDPENELKSLCRWLEVEYSPQMLEFYDRSEEAIPDEHQDLFQLARRPIDASRAFAWRRSMSRRAIADVEWVAQDLIRDLDYDMSGAKRPLWLTGVRWLFQRLRPLVRRASELDILPSMSAAFFVWLA